MRPTRPGCQPEFKRPEHRDEIGFQINGLSHMIRWLTHQYSGPDGPFGAGVHGWLIGFLYDNRDRDIYQRDLQKQFSVRRSTMTGILQTMERDGLIVRTPVAWDARLKKIELTEKAIENQERIRRHIRKIEDILASQLTKVEKEEFIRMCNRIRQGIELAGKELETSREDQNEVNET